MTGSGPARELREPREWGSRRACRSGRCQQQRCGWRPQILGRSGQHAARLRWHAHGRRPDGRAGPPSGRNSEGFSLEDRPRSMVENARELTFA